MGDELRDILTHEQVDCFDVYDEVTTKQHELIGPVVFVSSSGTRRFCLCTGCKFAYKNTGE